MDKGYDFLQENIKEEKMGPRKILLKMVRLIALGLVLGMAICVGFFAIKPWAEKLFPLNPEKDLHKFTVLSVADIFAEVIEHVHNYKEISSCFY